MSKPLDSAHKPRVSLLTLGCKLNYAESSTISKAFLDRGFELVDAHEQADVLVLNTCSVTASAERECRQVVRRALKRSPSTFIAVTGCYAQLRPSEIADIAGVDAVVGAEQKFRMLELIPEFIKDGKARIYTSAAEDIETYHGAASSVEDSRSRSFLKIQDGCDYACSYCTIPMARGASRSPSIDEVLEQARMLCASGFHEIVLSGVNVGEFGRDREGDLLSLLERIEVDLGITARIRISSIEPNLLSDSIIRFVARSSKFCHHFHVPLQSGSPSVLRAMQRRYKRDVYRDRVSLIKELMPDACIGADVIVGFPGESDACFQETVDFIEALPVSYLHVFSYSERPGTTALKLVEVVPPSVRKSRNEVLRELSRRKLRSFYATQIGQRVTVILDHTSSIGDIREGYSANYIRVHVTGVPLDAEVIEMRMIAVEEDHMLGEVLHVGSSHRTIPLPVL